MIDVDQAPRDEEHARSASGRWSQIARWRPGVASEAPEQWRPQVDPGTGQPFAHVLDLGVEDVVRHVAHTRTAYDGARIPSVPERAELLSRMATLVEAAAADLGELDARCTGKRRSEAVATAHAGAAVLRHYAALLAEDPFSSPVASEIAGVRQFVDRVPVGLAACILPWNFPVSQTCARLAMLFAAGNAAIFKGSELAQPPLLALEELAREAGLPSWALSVVTGGPDVGRTLIEANAVDAVCFTGGVPTGLAVAQTAASSLKRLVLELGGKTPFVVFADADQDAALDAAVTAAFAFQGQACNAGSLLLVEQPIYDAFADRVARRAEGLAIGHQLAQTTQLGPMISAPQRERITRLVDEAVEGGARLRAGGEAVTTLGDGFYFQPTVLSEVPAAAHAATEELFGPVVTASPFQTEAEVIAQINGSPYGLAATAWTTDDARADRLRHRLRVGQLYLNTHGHIGRNVPWGGFRLSGLGRLYGRDGLYAFTEARSTYALDPST